MTLHSIPQAVQALTNMGKTISKRRLWQMVQTGEVKAVTFGGKLHVVDLDTQISEKAEQETARRREAHRIRPVSASQTPRRFGNGRKAS